MKQLIQFIAFSSILVLSALEGSRVKADKVMESFEGGVPEGLEVTGRPLSLDARRMKHGEQSIKWEWQGNDVLTFDTPIGYRKQRNMSEINADYPDLHASPEMDILEPPRGFFLWVYNDRARPQRLRIEFGRGEEVDCWFDYNLNFKGWRTIAINYDQGDMRGIPREDMTRLTINAPATGSGTFYLDVLGLSVPMNERTVNANPQLPEIDRHPRLVSQYAHLLYEYSKFTPTFSLQPLEESTLADFRTLENQATAYYLTENERAKWRDQHLANIEKKYEKFGIVREGDAIYGRPLAKSNIMYEYFTELGLSRQEAMAGIMSWRNDFGADLLSIAKAWNYTESVEAKDQLEEMFINLFDYGVDQGFDTGAGLGWIHHHSYVIREYAPAMFLMRGVLADNGRLEKAVEISKWFFLFNQVYREDVVYDVEGRVAGEADDMQGLLTQRLLCALMMPDSPEKARDLRHFSSYFSNITTGYANALDEAFKPDGTIFHHAGHSLGYGGRAIYGAVRTMDILKGTLFRASAAAESRLGKVVETFYACLFGEQLVSPKAFASIRFANYSLPAHFSDMDDMLQLSGEPFSGVRMLPYSCVGLKRQSNDWMITVRGHSKYVYPFESWSASYFAFPLFIANGYLDVAYPDSLDSLTPAEGIWHEGFDWRRYPGTTSVRLPFERIVTRVGQVRGEGGEYLFSDQAFSGGVETSYGCGIQVFPFKGHDKFSLESFTGNKSYFFVGNKVVCLGTDIRSEIKDYSVETTLFQAPLGEDAKNLILNGKEITDFPFEQNSEGENAIWMIDQRGTGYYLPSGVVHLALAEQTNPQFQNEGEVTGKFATAWIDHGKEPRSAEYAYVLVADANATSMAAFAQDPTVSVIRQDSEVHVVEFAEENATAYAVYAEEGGVFETGIVKAVNKQSTFIAKWECDRIRLSVSDPDLNIYDGQDDLLPDGTRCELSTYEREWFFWPSRPNTVRITLNGEWEMDDLVIPMETVETQSKVVSSAHGETVVDVVCRDGLSTEMILKKIAEK